MMAREGLDREGPLQGFIGMLEELADERKSCEIIFRTEEGGRAVIRAKIVGLDFRDGKYWISTDSGLDIATGRLEEVNGVVASKFS